MRRRDRPEAIRRALAHQGVESGRLQADVRRGLIAFSVLASVLSTHLGLPLLLVFLLAGMLAGEDGPGGIVFDDFPLAYVIGNLGLAVILLDGGLRTAIGTFRVALRPAAVLATWGVMASAALTGACAAWVLDISWQHGLLLGRQASHLDAVRFQLVEGVAVVGHVIPSAMCRVRYPYRAISASTVDSAFVVTTPVCAATPTASRSFSP